MTLTKKMHLHNIIGMTITAALVMVGSLPCSAEVIEKNSYESLETLELNLRLGAAWENTGGRIDCSECEPSSYDLMSEASLDALYSWSEWQAGVTASLGQGILESNQYHLGLMMARRYELNRWLMFRAAAEVGVHVMHDIASGLFTHALNDIDDALLPYVGMCLGIQLKPWESRGFTLGFWGNARKDLVKVQIRTRVVTDFMGETVDTVDFEVGGHMFAGGMTLGWEI